MTTTEGAQLRAMGWARARAPLRVVAVVTPRAFSLQAAEEPRAEQAVGAARFGEREADMVVAVVAANVVHPPPVVRVSTIDRSVPLARRAGRVSDDRVAPHAPYHELVDADRVRPVKIMHSPLRVADTHMSDARAAERARAQRPPDHRIGEPLPRDVYRDDR